MSSQAIGVAQSVSTHSRLSDLGAQTPRSAPEPKTEIQSTAQPVPNRTETAPTKAVTQKSSAQMPQSAENAPTAQVPPTPKRAEVKMPDLVNLQLPKRAELKVLVIDRVPDAVPESVFEARKVDDAPKYTPDTAA